MSFLLIKGRFKPEAGIPDGDSVRFHADKLSLWSKLEGRAPELGTGAKTKDTVQLRFEGIDAIEKGAKPPTGVNPSLSSEARDSMFSLIGYDEDTNAEPEGYVLTRMTDDKSGRPIAFAFAGKTSRKDGDDDVFLDAKMLRGSVNYLQMKAGFAYPLYYNTLFASLRDEFDQALAQAKNGGKGYWPTDATTAGVKVTSKADLASIAPICPKLWRRIEEWFRHNSSLQGFTDFLTDKNERLDVLDVMEERGLQDVVEVTGNKVRLTERPENLRIVGEAGRRR